MNLFQIPSIKLRRPGTVLILLCCLQGIVAAVADQPNIVFILADDLGYGDLGCYGHPSAKTPHLDQIARQGVRFTQHYANGPECSPTRTALLTGRYQQRTLGLECAIGTGNAGRYDDAIRLAKQRRLGLRPDLTVLPSALRRAGYACGVFGKWHLGYEPRFNPMEHGWDEFIGYLGGNVHYFNHRETSDLHVLFRGRLPIYREGYMTHLITDDAIDFIERHQDKPFFLYVAHESPHFPFQGPQDPDKRVTAENWMELDAKAYVAMLEDLDREVNRISLALRDANVDQNTLFVFASDNGGFPGAAHMGPLRGAKGQTFEGGIRVPLIAHWPGHIEGGREDDQVCATFDLTKSFLALAKTDVDPERLDGYDIIAHAAEARPSRDRTLFWRGRRGQRTWRAVRAGDLKYVSETQGDTFEEWLFDLANDVGEQDNLVKQQESAARQMRSLLSGWEASMRRH